MNKKDDIIHGFKGFDKDLKCRGFQYEIGKDYEQEGKVKCCDRGFHFCENPFDVFRYYSPSDSRYCEVEGDGNADKANDDSKVATSHIHISAEIGLNGLIKAGVKFILDKVNFYDAKSTNTGDQSAATVEGKESVAIVTGKDCRARGSLGCWIVLTERGDLDGNIYPIKEVKAFKVDGVNIKENTFYRLVDGKPVEVE
ncbi:MAG: DUF7666 domain-containing protein [Prevotella pectinovora]